MAEEIFSKLLLGAIEQHDRAVRWSWVLLSILAVFHVTTFEAFVDTSREMSRSEQELSRIEKSRDRTSNASKSFRSGIAEVQRTTELQVKSAFSELRERFAVLNLDVAKVWCWEHKQDRPAEYKDCVKPAYERMSPRHPPRTDQVQLGASRGTIEPAGAGREPWNLPVAESEAATIGALSVRKREKLNLLPEEQAKKVAGLPKRDIQVIDVLEPFIEKELIQPVFTKLNDFWRDEQLPKVKALTDAVATSLDEFEKFGGEIGKHVRVAAAAVEKVKKDAASLVVGQPGQKRWWFTLQGKNLANEHIVDHIKDEVLAQLIVSEGFKAVFKDFSMGSAAEEKVIKQLTAVKARLRKDFEAQLAQLGEVFEPLNALAINLEFFCRHFALILALVGAAALVWQSERLRVARLTAEIARAEGQDISAWRWFERRRMGAGRAVVSRLGGYLLGAALILWVVYTAWRLTQLDGTPAGVWKEAALGILVLLGAMLWRWRVLGFGPFPMAAAQEDPSAG